MSELIPNEWLSDPPQHLVAGNGPYAAALAQVLGTVSLHIDQLQNGPDLRYSPVLDDVRTLVLVVPEEMPAPEALCHHQWLWAWIEKLTRGKHCHAGAFVFVLGSEVPAAFDHALAVGLAFAVLDPKICGHATWRRSGSLADLTGLVAQTVRKDLQDLRCHRSADVRGKSLRALATAARSDPDDTVWSTVVNAVADAFRNRDNDLDLFCLPPCHRNGHLLREWLHSAVTEPVTPNIKKRGKELIPLIRSDVLNI